MFYWHLVAKARDAVKHLTMHRTTLTKKNDPAQNVNTTDAEKLWSLHNLAMSAFTLKRRQKDYYMISKKKEIQKKANINVTFVIEQNL